MGIIDLLAIGAIALDRIFEVDRLPTPYFEGIVQSFGNYFGGRAPNVAGMCARLGLKTGIVSPVGKDFVSSGYKEHLERLGVDLRGVAYFPTEDTMQILIFTDPFGQQITFFYPGASMHFKDMGLPTHLIKESRILHISSSGDPEFNIKCAELAYDDHIPVSFDVGNDPSAEIPEYLRQLVRCTFFLFMNDAEVDGVVQRLDLEKVQDLLDYGPKVVCVISKKDKSSSIYSKNSVDHIHPKVLQVREPTGASDGYVSGFLSAHVRGYRFRNAGMMGAAELTFIVENIGSQTNLPTWDSLCERCKSLFTPLL